MRRASLFMGLVLIAAPVLAADPSHSVVVRPMPSMTTEAFLARTAAGNAFDLESSKLAVSRTGSTAVRIFAEQAINDHSRAGEKFKTTLSEIGVKAPSDELDAQHRMVIEDLKSKEAADFDKEYVQAQYNAHVETVQMFQAYAADGENNRVKAFAVDLLPQLKEHLDHVKKLRK